MRQLDDEQYLLSLSKRLNEITKELKGLPDLGSEALGGWLRLHDTSVLVDASAILHRLGLWAKYPNAEQYVDRERRSPPLRLIDDIKAMDHVGSKPW